MGYQSRTIDIDIISFENEIVQTETLEIPHPQMQNRLFVLLPINDLQLDFIYRANFAKFYLDNKNLKNYHMSVKPEECFPTVVPQWNAVNFSNVSMTNIQRYTAPALDGNHPGIEAHSILAMQLYNELFDAHNK